MSWPTPWSRIYRLATSLASDWHTAMEEAREARRLRSFLGVTLTGDLVPTLPKSFSEASCRRCFSQFVFSAWGASAAVKRRFGMVIHVLRLTGT